MSLFWSAVAALAALVTIVIWVRKELRERPRRLVYPILLVVLTVISTWQLHENQEIRDIRMQALRLVASWPDPEGLDFYSKGENIGVALSGLAFLEEHRDVFPRTYETAVLLVENRLKGFTPPEPGSPEDFQEFNLAEDIAGAMIRLVASIAGCSDPPQCT